MGSRASLQATVYGRVQGVFYRDYVRRRARELGVMGYVRNSPAGTVEVVAEGEKVKLEKLLGYLKAGPPAAEVEKVETLWSEYSGDYHEFQIKY